MTVEEYMERHHVDGKKPVAEVAYDISFWELFRDFCKENHFPEDTVTDIRCAGELPAETRTVLITDGMTGDWIYLRTNAPKKAMEDWCRSYQEELENGENTFLDSLKAQYQVDVISLSEECEGDVLEFAEEAEETYDLQYYAS